MNNKWTYNIKELVSLMNVDRNIFQSCIYSKLIHKRIYIENTATLKGNLDSPLCGLDLKHHLRAPTLMFQ